MVPAVMVHGIYRVRYKEATLRAQLLDYYCKTIDAEARVTDLVGRVIPLVLMDLSISDVDERFEIAEFTQEMPSAPKKAWQVPYDESLLSADGTVVLARRLGCAKGIREGRIAFYFHYYDPDQPMQWTYGAFSCPRTEPVNVRLLSLLPYEPI
jgi:hypothetical protein